MTRRRRTDFFIGAGGRAIVLTGRRGSSGIAGSPKCCFVDRDALCFVMSFDFFFGFSVIVASGVLRRATFGWKEA